MKIKILLIIVLVLNLLNCDVKDLKSPLIIHKVGLKQINMKNGEFGITGAFIFGIGSINGKESEQYYLCYIKLDTGEIIPVKVPFKKARFIESAETQVEFYTHSNWKLTELIHYSDMWYIEKVIFYIPKNSIIENFDINFK